jgi:VWFA-related protein
MGRSKLGHTPKLIGRLSCMAAAVCLIVLTAQAQVEQAPQGIAATPAIPSITVATHQILLDVLVTDKSHHPVVGLTAADFKVTEEGTSQTLKNVEEHQPMTAADQARLKAVPALPPNTYTNFTPVANTNASTVILLDALDTPIEAQMYLREQLIDYLRTMQPGTSIAIFQLDTGMRLIQGFSSDPAVLLAAARSKRNMPSLRRPVSGPGEEYRRIKREILRDGMQMIGRYLADYPGRKNLIWFTGQVPLTILGTGLGNPFKDGFSVDGYPAPEDLADVLTVSRVAIYPIDTRGLLAPPQYDAGQRGRPSSNSNMRFESRQAFDHLDLDQVAEATGGKAYYNTNGLKDVIAEVISNGSNYYTLAYTTTNTKWGGQFRNIKVSVDRPGVSLQHRQGYYAVNRDKQEQRQLAALQKRQSKTAQEPPASDPRAPELAPTPAAEDDDSDQAPPVSGNSGALIHHSSKGGFAASMALGAVAPTELIFTASLAPSDEIEKLEKKAPLPKDNYMRPDWQGKPFRNFTVLLNADGQKLKFTQTPDGIHHATIEFVAVVYDQSGETVNSLMQTATLDLGDASYRRMMATGVPAREEIAVPAKGNFFLRLGVHDVPGNRVGALEIPVDQVSIGVAGQGIAGR